MKKRNFLCCICRWHSRHFQVNETSLKETLMRRKNHLKILAFKLQFHFIWFYWEENNYGEPEDDGKIKRKKSLRCFVDLIIKYLPQNCSRATIVKVSFPQTGSGKRKWEIIKVRLWFRTANSKFQWKASLQQEKTMSFLVRNLHKWICSHDRWSVGVLFPSQSDASNRISFLKKKTWNYY